MTDLFQSRANEELANMNDRDVHCQVCSLQDHATPISLLAVLVVLHLQSVCLLLASSIALLKDELINIPARHIDNTFKQHKSLFESYVILEEQLRTYNHTARSFAKPPRPRKRRGIELVLIERGSRLPKELRAAKKKVENEAGEEPTCTSV